MKTLKSLLAALEMLDEEHQDLSPNGYDTHMYYFGRIGEHNVILACPPTGLIGIASAASVAIRIISRML